MTLATVVVACLVLRSKQRQARCSHVASHDLSSNSLRGSRKRNDLHLIKLNLGEQKVQGAFEFVALVVETTAFGSDNIHGLAAADVHEIANNLGTNSTCPVLANEMVGPVKERNCMPL